MKRKYVSVKLEILMMGQDVIKTSFVSDDPNTDDGYELSGFTGLFG